jgi:hypothetical protein
VLLCRDTPPRPLPPSGFVVRRTQQIVALALGLMGVALVAVGLRHGPWPLSVQLVAGVLLIAYACLRWRLLHR